MTCRICDGPLEYRFSLDVLGGRHRADYHECKACRSLQIPNPTWLDEAYRDNAAAVRGDGGRFRRTFSAFVYLTALMRGGVLPPRPKLLDFGGGYGLLAQMLASAGYDAYTTDRYEPHRLFAVDRWIDDVDAHPAGSFDVVTALEVFEHLTEPHGTATKLRRLLRPGGSLVLSTGIYDTERHSPQWPYLAPETGQHVTFYSRRGLAHLAKRLGFPTVAHFPGDQGILILFSPMSADVLRPALMRAYEALADERHVHRVTRAWDLRAGGWVPDVSVPRTESID